MWRDPISGATELAGKFEAAGTAAAVTGALAATALAPFSMTIAPLVLYVDVDTPAELQGVCRDLGQRVVDGGRLRLAPFPTPCTSALVDCAWRPSRRALGTRLRGRHRHRSPW